MALLESEYMTYLVFRLLSENLICLTANINGIFILKIISKYLPVG